MKKLFLSTCFIALTLLTSCSDDDSGVPDNAPKAKFTVTVKNIQSPTPVFESGVFKIPVGKNSKGPLFPGDSYEFNVHAGPVVLKGDNGSRLSFVTMFVQSNDLFFAPDKNGISLYDDKGDPIGGNGPTDVTDQVKLWDAGTEVNEETGGPNQKPQQDPMAEDQGEDENGMVHQVTDNKDDFGNVIPDVADVIKVTIENTAPSEFKVHIEDVSTPNTIPTPAKGKGKTAAVPISPGVFAVHTMPAPFFKVGEPAANGGFVGSAEGVENIAEDGFPQALGMDTKAKTGLISPLSPGVFAVHNQGNEVLYSINAPDFGDGLEAISEDGKPMQLVQSLASKDNVTASGGFNMPVGSNSPGPATPGKSYQFSFMASAGESLSLATMFTQSNDWFYAFAPSGLPLFDGNGQPVSGDVTNKISLYDNGTEIDQYPGVGLAQVFRQPSVNFGADDPNAKVRIVKPSDHQNVPENSNVIQVTITSEPQ